jgi:hypothetical protein
MITINNVVFNIKPFLYVIQSHVWNLAPVGHPHNLHIPQCKIEMCCDAMYFNACPCMCWIGARLERIKCVMTYVPPCMCVSVGLFRCEMWSLTLWAVQYLLVLRTIFEPKRCCVTEFVNFFSILGQYDGMTVLLGLGKQMHPEFGWGNTLESSHLH